MATLWRVQAGGSTHKPASTPVQPAHAAPRHAALPHQTHHHTPHTTPQYRTTPCPAGVPPALTLTEAFTTLGLAEGATYDEVLAAKNSLLARHADDFERRMEVGGKVGWWVGRWAWAQ